MAASESIRHLELKRLSLAWAQAHGYRVAAAEVSIPNFRARLDAAAFRPHPPRKAADARATPPGVTAIFECKQSRADFSKDSRCAEKIAARLATLHERRTRYEASMRLHTPSLRTADTLFPEFDSYRFETAGYEPYDRLTKELRLLANRLHAETKLADLFRWRAANLHYLVAEEGVAKPHEVPHGWGLLIRESGALTTKIEPIWQEASEAARMTLLLRIAMAGTRAVHRALGLAWEGTGRNRRREQPKNLENSDQTSAVREVGRTMPAACERSEVRPARTQV